jgi:hypothetical protein
MYFYVLNYVQKWHIYSWIMPVKIENTIKELKDNITELNQINLYKQI